MEQKDRIDSITCLYRRGVEAREGEAEDGVLMTQNLKQYQDNKEHH